MEDAIVAMLNALSDGTAGNTNDLLLSPADYNHTMWEAAVTINNVAVKPITAVILSIMFMIMLASTASRTEGDRELGVRIVAVTLFKMAMVLIVVQNAVHLLEALNYIGTAIADGAKNANFGGDTGEAVKIGDQAKNAIKDAGMIKQLGMLVILLLPFIVKEVVGVLATVLIFVRFLQLYMLTSFASLPVAFFGHDDTKPMAIGFLKRYGSTVLSGVMIIIAVLLYQALLGGWIGGNIQFKANDDIWGFIIGNFGKFLVAPAVLGFLLFGHNSLAKAIIGEG